MCWLARLKLPRRHHRRGRRPRRAPAVCGGAAVQQIGLTTWDQATLLKRVWGFDALTCARCGGRMRFITVITSRGDRAHLEAHRQRREGPLVREGARSLRPVGVRAWERAESGSCGTMTSVRSAPPWMDSIRGEPSRGSPTTAPRVPRRSPFAPTPPRGRRSATTGARDVRARAARRRARTSPPRGRRRRPW